MIRRAVVSACLVAVFGAHVYAGEPPKKLDLAGLPANTWVSLGKNAKAPQAFCSTWYSPATDEFFIWGKIGGHRHESKRYEVMTLSLRDPAPTWRESFPIGKEKAWSNGQFPNWGCRCHRLRHKPKRPWLKSPNDQWIGSGRTNVVTFVKADGVLRPTRCPTYNQGTVDTKRGRVLYYVGGKTFAYDPKKREWTDLKAKAPLACEGLVFASMCYDPVGDQVVLFGGAFALNPWGGAKTWVYDCAKNEWRRPKIGPDWLNDAHRRLGRLRDDVRGLGSAAKYLHRWPDALRKRLAGEAAKAEGRLQQVARTARNVPVSALTVDHGSLMAAGTLARRAAIELAKARPLLGAGTSPGTVKALKLAGDLVAKAAELTRTEPPLGCSTRMVYDSKNKVMVLFGGDAQSKFLADTWVFSPATMRWAERKPSTSPPPLDRYAACFVERHGLVFLVSNPRRVRGRTYRKLGAWTYDVAKNKWTPVRGRLPDTNIEWMSCDYSARDDVVLLTAPGAGTWVYRLDPATAPEPKRPGVPPGTWVWNNRGRRQMTSLLGAPAPDRNATEQRLRNLPVNTVVNSNYPGWLTSKTWSTAIIDIQRGVIIYIGGGHSGYKGEDIALYDIGTNRWYFQAPPNFIPFLYNYNSALFGWTYGFRPTSQHTYRWYCYDPPSRTVVYFARRLGIHNGMTVLLGDDPSGAFAYSSSRDDHLTWIYDTVRNRLYPPIPGRHIRNSWSMALVGTPSGTYVRNGRNLYRCQVGAGEEKATISYKVVDAKSPSGPGEFHPLVYDSLRNRLLLVAAPGRNAPVRVHQWPLPSGPWKTLATSGPTKNSREVVYDSKNDCLLSMPTRALMVMDCKTNRWRELDVNMPKGSYGTECAMLYDPVHEVTVMLVPRSFSSKMQVMLFRYDPRTAKYKSGGK